MTRENARKKIEKHGYKVTTTMQGNYIASNGRQSYMAGSLNGLVKKLF